jgi:Zn-dependent peptidase ImmA (M78 family)
VNENLEEEARAILSKFAVREPPIPVEEIAKKLGATIAYEPFDGNVSGLLYRAADRILIGVNTSQVKVRQRFTIAHEIAHLQLHGKQEMFVDNLVRVDFRDDLASAGTDLQETEANAFAASLLMPRDMIMDCLKRSASTATDDADLIVVELAELFDVSRQAMEYRLVNLGMRGHM